VTDTISAWLYVPHTMERGIASPLLTTKMYHIVDDLVLFSRI